MDYDDYCDYVEYDEWYPYGCDDPDCIMPAEHYASECCTAEMMEDYYASLDDYSTPNPSGDPE